MLPLLRSLSSLCLSCSLPPLSPSLSPVLWFRVGFSSATTQTQPVRTDNSCLLFNTVQRASWQAKIWNHFFFIPMIFCMVSHSAFCKAGSNWLEAANLRTFSPLSNVQSCNISKIVFRGEEMPKKCLVTKFKYPSERKRFPQIAWFSFQLLVSTCFKVLYLLYRISLLWQPGFLYCWGVSASM